jgi:tRNA G10  N-methylase Trm11
VALATGAQWKKKKMKKKMKNKMMMMMMMKKMMKKKKKKCYIECPQIPLSPGQPGAQELQTPSSVRRYRICITKILQHIIAT